MNTQNNPIVAGHINNGAIAIAFANRKEASGVMATVGAIAENDPFHQVERLHSVSDDAKQIFVGRGPKGIAAIELIGKIVADYNADMIGRGMPNYYVRHGATAAWFAPFESGVIITNSDGSVTTKLATQPDGYFPVRLEMKRRLGKDLGLTFKTPVVSVLKVTIDLEDNFHVKQELYQCRPANAKANMAEGLSWQPLCRENGEPIVNVYTSLTDTVRGVYGCGLNDRKCEYLHRAVDALSAQHDFIVAQRPTTMGDSLDGRSLEALNATKAALVGKA